MSHRRDVKMSIIERKRTMGRDRASDCRSENMVVPEGDLSEGCSSKPKKPKKSIPSGEHREDIYKNGAETIAVKKCWIVVPKLASPIIESDTLKYVVAKLNELIDKYMSGSNNRQNVLSLLRQIDEYASVIKGLDRMSFLETDKLVKFLSRLASLIERRYPNEKYDVKRVSSKDLLLATRASLICLTVLTSTQIPKRVYLEDVVNQVLLFSEHLVRSVINLPIDPQQQSLSTKKEMMKWSPLNVDRDVQNYNILQLVRLTGVLLDIQVLPKDMIFQLLSFAVSVFFHTNQMQLKQAYLKIILAIFLKYEKLSIYLFNKILDCLSSIPHAKQIVKILESRSKEHMHPFTKLVLEIIQGIITVSKADLNINTAKCGKSNITEVLIRRYDMTVSLAVHFLILLHNRLEDKLEPLDKDLYDIFIRDLLATLNKPEWPVSEVLTRSLGKLLRRNFTGNCSVSLKVTSLDVLGCIAAKLRSEAVIVENTSIDDLVASCYHSTKEAFTSTMGREIDVLGDKENQLLFIQYVLVTFLNGSGSFESSDMFYFAQWYNNSMQLDESKIEDDEPKKKRRRSNKTQDSKQDKIQSKATVIETMIDRYKKFNYNHCVSYEDAHLMLRHLSSTGHLSQHFELYLDTILCVLVGNQPAQPVAVRVRAIKSLNTIVEADPSVFERPDVESAIKLSIFDSSALLREAAVDSIGKFLKGRSKYFERYLHLLFDRCLDIAGSVRKMVIRILSDLSSNPDNSVVVPEINLYLIRRVKDEESVKKLVCDLFRTSWYSDENSQRHLESVTNQIVETVSLATPYDLECLVQLQCLVLRGTSNNMDKTMNVTVPRRVSEICKQIIKNLIGKFMCETKKPLSLTLAYFKTLWIFAKSVPKMLAKHFDTLIECLRNYHSSSEGPIITQVVKIIDLVLPVVQKVDASQMLELSDVILRFALILDKEGIQSCFLCLSNLLKVTKNYRSILERLVKCYEFMKDYEVRLAKQITENIDVAQQRQQYCLRMAIVTGSILRHVNFQPCNEGFDLNGLVGKIYTLLIRLFNLGNDIVKSYVLNSLGDISANFSSYMLAPEVQDIYCSYLNSRDSAAARLKITILNNIRMYLVAEDEKVFRKYLLERGDVSSVDLKKMDDSSASLNALVLQRYLKSVLEAYFDLDPLVRRSVSELIEIFIKQALTHPINIGDYIMCMVTDTEQSVSTCALSQMRELEKKYPGFIHSKLISGIALSFRLQKLLQNEVAITRGLIVDKKTNVVQSVNHHLYLILKNKKQKRALLMSMLRKFEDTDPGVLPYQLYLADNLAYFPYSHMDEPLFILHNIDTIVSTVGENLIEDFKNSLTSDSGKLQSEENPGVTHESSIWMMDVDFDEKDFTETLLKNLPVDIGPLKNCLRAAQSCWLLLNLKKHLKYAYGISDARIQRYSQLVPDKSNEKVATAKRDKVFCPDVLDVLNSEVGSCGDDRRQLVCQYIKLKKLIIEFDS